MYEHSPEYMVQKKRSGEKSTHKKKKGKRSPAEQHVLQFSAHASERYEDADEIVLGSPHNDEGEEGVPLFESDNEGRDFNQIIRVLRDEDNAFLARTAEQTGRFEDMHNIVSTMLAQKQLAELT